MTVADVFRQCGCPADMLPPEGVEQWGSWEVGGDDGCADSCVQTVRMAYPLAVEAKNASRADERLVWGAVLAICETWVFG